jgi:hypothetical protein
MGDKRKVIERHRDMARQMAEPPPARIPIRCASCKRHDREVEAMVEMGGFVFCDTCIEKAHSVIAVRKAGR